MPEDVEPASRMCSRFVDDQTSFVKSIYMAKACASLILLQPSTLLPNETAAELTRPPNPESYISSLPSNEQPIRPLPPNSTIVHSETVENGIVQTVRQIKQGTSFFSKVSSPPRLSCKDPKDGPHGFSKRFAALLGHKVEIRHLSQGRGYRSYGSYPDWPRAMEYFRGQPHGEEVLVEGRPCKPYLDMERDGGLPDGETLESVVTQFQDAIMRVFAEDYSVKLDEGAFNWVPCDYGPGGKFSLHLINAHPAAGLPLESRTHSRSARSRTARTQAC